MTPQERLIATAVDQVGYIGHRSNSQLDTPTANGGGKYNKFARDLDALGDFYNGPKNGFDWCDVFVDWCFVQTFGRNLAQKLTFQPDRSCGAGTAYSLGYYKNHGHFVATPQPGDQIFFGDARSTWHTGIVTRVAGGTVYTVEGNAGSPLGVHEFRYFLSTPAIKGFGRPDWSAVGGGDTNTPTAPPSQAATPTLKVGDIVTFTGKEHYTSSSGSTSFPCKPGKARVTRVAAGARHPYHLIHLPGDGSVYGWVNAADIKA